jgi:hypothetical protein
MEWHTYRLGQHDVFGLLPDGKEPLDRRVHQLPALQVGQD